jgi:uncharacterized protein YggE
MKKILAAALVLFSMAASAQEKPAFTAPANSVYVGADGKFESAPDTAVITFNISAQADSSRDAYERGRQAAEQVRQVLRQNGVDPASAEMGFFSLQPVYDYRTPKRKLVGYRVDTNVTVKLKDFTKVGPIVEQFADMDVTADQNLQYTLENIDAAKVRAVEDAVQRARNSAAAVARAGGRTLGELSYASVDVFEPVAPPILMRAMKAEAAGAPPPPTAEFAPQKITVTAHVNALFLLK